MNDVAPHSHRHPFRMNAVAWLAVFFSPTAYLLLLLVVAGLRVPLPQEAGVVVVGVFCLIPVVALVVCGRAAWRWNPDVSWKVGGLAMTAVGMLLQVGFLMVFIISAVTVAISPAQ